ncbi:unnamed protein product, partial [Didymodactylos carnosus]
MLNSLTLKTLRIVILTVGTTSSIYALLSLSRFLKKKFVLENLINKRLSLKTLISSQNEKNEIIKQNILELRNKLESLQIFYYKLNDDQEILSQTMYKYIKDYEHNLDLQQQKNVSDEEQVSLTFTEYDNQDNSSLVMKMDKSHYEKKQNQQAGDASRDIILQ